MTNLVDLLRRCRVHVRNDYPRDEALLAEIDAALSAEPIARHVYLARPASDNSKGLAACGDCGKPFSDPVHIKSVEPSADEIARLREIEKAAKDVVSWLKSTAA